MGCCFACFRKKDILDEVNDNDIVSTDEVTNMTGKESSVITKDTRENGMLLFLLLFIESLNSSLFLRYPL